MENKDSTSITFRIDRNLKKEAEDLFRGIGLNMTTAYTIFLKKSIEQHGIPFPVKRRPNKATLEAFKEEEEIMKHPESTKSYDTFSEILEEIQQEIAEEA
ncbi:MAG: type II toxin-antitoxin system RelB/DinJ family antitoxin [Fusobacteriaceae bacterium]|jgi:DNA-damage-inducible protein J|nr:type II toxin-antitoxin system RelB/DinJ family antitoxin [Fusobacteriaceae bacterium]